MPRDPFTERRTAERRAKRATVDAWLAGADRRERNRRAIVSARQALWYQRFHNGQS